MQHNQEFLQEPVIQVNNNIDCTLRCLKELKLDAKSSLYNSFFNAANISHCIRRAILAESVHAEVPDDYAIKTRHQQVAVLK